MRISDWSSDVCSSDLYRGGPDPPPPPPDAVYSGTYDAEGRWTGSWDGTYEAPDGRRYEGRYEGTVEGRPGVDYAPPPYDPYYDRTYRGGYDPRDDADMVRRCGHGNAVGGAVVGRSEEHTSELQSLMRISYAVFCLKKKTNTHYPPT